MKTSNNQKTEAKTARRSSGRLQRRIGRIPKHEWNESKPMWVIGTIDSYGAITARASTSRTSSPMHGIGDGNGHRWRWNVWGQDFHAVNGNDINADECLLVKDWLERKGYIYPPNVPMSHMRTTKTP